MGTLYEIVFDEEFLGGLTLRCTPNKAYHLPSSCLLNLSYSVRLKRERREGGEGARYTPTYHRHSSPHLELHGTDTPQREVWTPQRGMGTPRRGVGTPQRGVRTPQRGVGTPQRGVGTPQRGVGTPQRGVGTPQRGVGILQRGVGTPQRGVGTPQRGVGTPQRGVGTPQRGVGTPQRGVGTPQRGVGMLQREIGFRPRKVGSYSDALLGEHATPTQGWDHTHQHRTQQQFESPVSECVRACVCDTCM